MGIEIERKFLVRSDAWRESARRATAMRQGYLTAPDAGPAARASVRVRIEGDRAFLNVKGLTLSVRREEFEYEIPCADGEAMLAGLCSGGIVAKTRFEVDHAGHTWEVDVFEGDNDGLVVAEIELDDEHEAYARPDWLGLEVSDEARYYNVSLARRPFREWAPAERAG